MVLAPYWLMPTPWPNPVTRNVIALSVHSTVKHAERSPRMLRTRVPRSGTPPMVTDSTRLELFFCKSVTQPVGEPSSLAVGSAARIFSRNYAGVKVFTL